MGLTMMVMTLEGIISELNQGYLPEEEREFLHQRQSYLQGAIKKHETDRNEFLQQCLRLLQGGHTLLGVYAWPVLRYVAGTYHYGVITVDEEDARRALSSFYDEHPEFYEEDRIYVAEKVQQVVVL